MKQVETNQKTFGKATKKLILDLVPTAKYIKFIGKDVLVKNINGNTVCTWHERFGKNGLIVIVD
jgi:hypothetical protein